MVNWKRADVVILTAIELEYAAVKQVDAGAAPGRWNDEKRNGLPVALREFIDSRGQSMRIVVARAPDMGKGSALTTLGPLVNELRPACIAMCGVCAGRSGKTALGDVVVGERLYDYDAGKWVEGFQADIRTYSLPVHWKIAAEQFDPKTRFGGEEWWQRRPVPYEWQEAWVLTQMHNGVPSPATLPERNDRCPQWSTVIERLRSEGYLKGDKLTAKGKKRAASVAFQYPAFPDLSPGGEHTPFQMHVKPIGTGNSVREDVGAWGFITQHMRTTLALEMEASALAEIVRARAHYDPIEAVVMKGVMDFANHGRDDHFKGYAARASAECLIAFLREQLRGGTVDSEEAPEPSKSPPSVVNTLQITGSHVNAANIMIGDQHIHSDRSSAQSLDAVEKLVDNGLLDAAMEQLEALERTSWSSMSPTEKHRHRKMQGRVLVRRHRPAVAADRFMEAADFTPDDEKAQVLRVQALMLRGDVSEAHEMASRLVAKYPNLATAKAAWITSAPNTARVDELLAKPWDGLAPEIATALAKRLLSEKRPNEALELLKTMHSSGVTLEYWTTYSIALLECYEQAVEKSPELLTEALQALNATYNLCGKEGLKEDKLQSLLNIGYVHRLRGDLDEEWRTLQAAHELDPKHQKVRGRMANALTDLGRTEEAISMFEALLENGPEHVPLFLGAALVKRNATTSADLQRAADLFEQTAKMVEAIAPELRLDGAEALVKVSCKMKQWDRALTACADFAAVLGLFRSKELEARIHIERGDSESAHTLLIELTENAFDISEEQRRTLGVLLQHVGDNERAFRVLDPIALRNQWNESTAALIRAAQATRRDEFTIRLCRQLRANGILQSSVVNSEATALANRGEVAAAISVVEEALTHQEDPFLRLRLSTLGIVSRRPELLEGDLSRLPRPDDSDPHVAVMTVGVLRAAGDHEVAIRYAYDAYRANRSNAEGWRALIEAFMPMAGPTNHVEPDVVSVDAAVLVSEGKDRRWIIIEATAPEAEHGEVPPDHPRAVAMLGKKVGDSVELPRSPLPPRICIVEEIRSKYVRAYHRCLEQWEELFPGIPGPLMFELPDNLEENIEEFMGQLTPMLQQKARRVEELAQLYRDKPITFHMLASGLGRSVFGAMAYLIAETDIALQCTRADSTEIRRLLTVLESGQKVILEASALSTLLLLEESELLSTSLRGRIAISQSTLDELRFHLREIEMRASGYMGYREGRIIMGEIDDASRARYSNLISDLLAKASECEVFQEVEHDRLSHDEWDKLVKIAGAGAVESFHRAMRTGEPVWCDDMVLSHVAHVHGVDVVWTQLMYHHLLAQTAMSGDRAHRISAKLVSWRFTSMSITPGIYLEAARLATWNPDHWPLQHLLRLFEVEPWDERSTVLLAVNVLREWWRHAPSDATANTVMVSLLERIAARTKGPVVLEAIEQVLEEAFGVDVLSYQRAHATLDAWMRARPLRRGA